MDEDAAILVACALARLPDGTALYSDTTDKDIGPDNPDALNVTISLDYYGLA